MSVDWKVDPRKAPEWLVWRGTRAEVKLYFDSGTNLCTTLPFSSKTPMRESRWRVHS
jgi:hypothetical protein